MAETETAQRASRGARSGLALLAAVFLAMAVLLTACGGDGGEAAEEGEYVTASLVPTDPVDDVYRFSKNETSGEPFKKDPPWNVHFAQYASDLPILAFFKQELEEYAKNYPNIKLTTSDGELDPSKFVADIQAAITRGVDAIIVEPADAQTAVPAVEQAAAAGIPVIAMQAELASTKVSSTVVASDIAAGRQQGEAMVEELKRRSDDGEAKGKLVIVNGLDGHQLTDEQNQGFKEVIGGHSGIEVVCDQYAEFQPSKAVEVLENCLQANPDADAAWYIGADVGPGLAAVAKRLNKDGENFFFVGGGSNRQTLEVMKEEKGLIVYDYIYPGAALPTLEVVQRLLSGESVPKHVLIDSPGITPDDVDAYLAAGTPYAGWPRVLPEPWR